MLRKNDHFNWGIVGCSSVARRRWIEGINTSSAASVTAIASRDLNKAKNWASELAIPKAYGSYQQLLDDRDIDAVFIGLPNALHPPWAIAALNAGKHVLCDKPLGVTADDVTQMIDAAQANKRLLMEGFMYQYHRQYEFIRNWISQGKIGTLRMVRVAFTFFFDRPGDFRYQPELGGGALLDLGCYCVNIIRRITMPNQPRRVFAKSILNETGVDWTTSALLEFDSDVTAILDCSFGYQGDQFLHIAGTEGCITSNRPVTPTADAALTLTRGDQTTIKTLTPANQYTACVDDFNWRVKSDHLFPCLAQDSLQNMKVLDAITASAKSQQPVNL